MLGLRPPWASWMMTLDAGGAGVMGMGLPMGCWSWLDGTEPSCGMLGLQMRGEEERKEEEEVEWVEGRL